ncbi:MAG: hypothetical protein MJ075_05305 [Oscillospiraceae bacterium]|nr:hypothetical protein [Oscillospiraceae bacterium]
MRPDGIKIKVTDPMYSLIPYFLTKRYDAMNMITLDMPVEPMKQYINEKRKEGIALSHVGLVIAAYLRTAAEYPMLNRFVGGKKVFQHKDFTVSMVVLRPGGGDTMSKIVFNMDDDVFEVQRKIDDYIVNNRFDEDQALDRIMKVILGIPGFMGLALAVLRFLDRHNMLPNALVKVSPFHASLLISNLASIRTNHIYHHVYDFGSTSVAMTMGNLREVPRRAGGEIVHDRCIPIGVVMDERICSGAYFSKAFGRLKGYLAHPETMEGKPDFPVLTAEEAAKI